MFRPNYLTKIISILKVIIRKTGKERERNSMSKSYAGQTLFLKVYRLISWLYYLTKYSLNQSKIILIGKVYKKM